MKALLKPTLSALAMTLAAAIPARIFLRLLYKIPALGEDFSAIFEQIKSAPMSSPFWLLLPIGFVFCLIASRMYERGKRVCTIVSGVFVLLIMLIGALWFTGVNGVLFGDVLLTLIPMLIDGVL